MKRRRSNITSRHELSAGSDESLGSEASFKFVTPPARGTLASPTHGTPTYMQTMMSLQTVSPHPKLPSAQLSPAPVRRASLRKPPKVYSPEEMREKSSGPKRRPVLHIQEPSLLYAPRDTRRGPSSRRVSSLRRSNSMDSVSVYSVASAPMDAHENMFQPMTLESIPSSAPAWATTHPDPHQTRSGLRPIPTQIREELAPETYVKHQPQWKVQPRATPQPQWKLPPSHKHRRTMSESSGTPPVTEDVRAPPVTRPSPAAIKIHPYPSTLPYALSERSESTAGDVSPVVPPGLTPSGDPIAPFNTTKRESIDGSSAQILVVPPTPSSAPPQVPARSPLRLVIG